jgi:hypothetical protein
MQEEGGKIPAHVDLGGFIGMEGYSRQSPELYNSQKDDQTQGNPVYRFRAFIQDSHQVNLIPVVSGMQ